MTLPEIALWQALRGSRTGLRFRRQHPVGPYVADFYCPAARLIVEVDGDVHSLGDRPRHDVARDAFLCSNSYRLLRVAAADILRDVESIVIAIVARAAIPLHHASHGSPPRAGGEIIC